MLILLGTSFRSSPLAFREGLRKLVDSDPGSISRLSGVRESAVLSTCNRVEAYLVSEAPSATEEGLQQLIAECGVPARAQFTYLVRGPDVARHLFRVAAGLDSIAVGEPEILQQVRQSGITARVEGEAKGILSPLFDRAYRVGKRVRSSSGFGSDEASLSALASRVVLDNTGQKTDVLLVGTGRMIQLAARRIKPISKRTYVASRRESLPESLAALSRVSYDEIARVAGRCGVVMAATSADGVVISRKALAGRRKLVVDLGMPRNVEGSARQLPNVRLFDLDDLAREALKRPAPGERTRSVERAVWKEAAEFYNWLVQTRLNSAISDLYAWAGSVRDSEVQRALRKLEGSSEKDRETMEVMARRIVSKLMAPPTFFARNGYRNLSEEDKLRLLSDMFGIGEGE